MTKTGSDHLKRLAREIARTTGRRFPDVLAALRRAPRPSTPRRSTELVLLCNGLAHPIDGGRCARPAGHHLLDGTWSWCSPEPGLPAHIWQGYHQAADEARQTQHETWLASLTPAERADWEAEQEAAYWADMAAEAREPYDPYDDKHDELVWDALDDERRADETDFDEYDDGDWADDIDYFIKHVNASADAYGLETIPDVGSYLECPVPFQRPVCSRNVSFVGHRTLSHDLDPLSPGGGWGLCAVVRLDLGSCTRTPGWPHSSQFSSDASSAASAPSPTPSS